MQRRIGQLVDKIRKRTSNNDSQSNVTDDEIIDSVNDAQEALMEVIIGNFGMRIFRKTYSFSLVADQYEYDFPVDLYDNGMIEMVQYTTASNPTEHNYSRIRPITPQETDLITGWYVRNGKIFIPFSTGTVRLTYIGKPTAVDLRRGKVKTVVAGSITIEDHETDNDLDSDDWITVVDRDGTIKQSAIYKTSFDKATGILLTDTTLTNVAADDYVVLGKKNSSHSEFTDRFERYLKTYANIDLYISDSSEDFTRESQKLAKMETGIADMAFMDNADILEPALTDI